MSYGPQCLDPNLVDSFDYLLCLARLKPLIQEGSIKNKVVARTSFPFPTMFPSILSDSFFPPTNLATPCALSSNLGYSQTC